MKEMEGERLSIEWGVQGEGSQLLSFSFAIKTPTLNEDLALDDEQQVRDTIQLFGKLQDLGDGKYQFIAGNNVLPG